MAKSRYTLELQEQICNAIAAYGMDEAGWKAGDISKGTFYEWQKRYPDFLNAISIAKSEYRKSSRNHVKRLANRAFVDYLNGSMTKMSHVKKEVLSVSGEVVQLEEWRTVPVGIPKWAIDRALGDGLTEIEAIATLAEQKILPQWIVTYAETLLAEARTKIAEAVRGELPETEIQRWIERQEGGESEQNGISDQTWADVRSQVMGIKQQQNSASDAAVSAKVSV